MTVDIMNEHRKHKFYTVTKWDFHQVVQVQLSLYIVQVTLYHLPYENLPQDMTFRHF